MAKFSDRVGSVLRNFTNSEQRIEGLKRRTNIYFDIEQTADFMEQTAINSLDKECNDGWLINKANQGRLKYQFDHGNIDSDDYVVALKLLEEEKEQIIADYIDSDFNLEIESSKSRLNGIKEKNKKMPGINDMDFKTWLATKQSAEVARIIRLNLENGADYKSAEEVANSLWRYQYDRHLKR